jgi:Leucine-rich repeat (LRR) protein
VADDETHLTGGSLLGTPAFVAPEQASQESGQPIDARADLFSLGCVLYRMCTGKLPFEGPDVLATLSAVLTRAPRPPAEIVPELPAKLCELIARMLDKKREGRPSSALEVVEALRALERGLAEPKQAETNAALTSGKPRRRSRVLLLVAAAVLVVGLVGGGLALSKFVFETPDGQIIVEVEDDAEVRFKKGEVHVYGEDGKPKYVLKPSEKNKSLPPGKYRVSVEGVDGLRLDTDKFEMQRKGKVVVRVSAATADEKKAKSKPEQKPQPTDGLTGEQRAWIDKTAKLPPAEQVKAVLAKLKEINPGFDDKGFAAALPQGDVVALELRSAKLKDVWPVLALKELNSLSIHGEDRDKSLLTDLPPLKGLTKLRKLTCTHSRVSDLSPLAGLKLTWLTCDHTNVADLAPLKGMPLTYLNCEDTRVADLQPLEGMKLTILRCYITQVSDLRPLKGMPLEHLNCGGFVGQNSKVSDLKPLKGMQLKHLQLQFAKVTDLSPLEGMTSLKRLDLLANPVSDLSPLKGLSLANLCLQSCGGVEDLSPLFELNSLESLDINGLGASARTERNVDGLESMKTLKTICSLPRDEFFRRIRAAMEADKKAKK